MTTKKEASRLGYYFIAAVVFLGLLAGMLIPAFAQGIDQPVKVSGVETNDYSSDEEVQSLHISDTQERVVKLGDTFKLKLKNLPKDLYKIRISEPFTPEETEATHQIFEKKYTTIPSDTETLTVTLPCWVTSKNGNYQINVYPFKKGQQNVNTLTSTTIYVAAPETNSLCTSTPEPPAAFPSDEAMAWSSGKEGVNDPDNPKPVYSLFEVAPSTLDQKASTKVTFTGLDKTKVHQVAFYVDGTKIQTLGVSDCPDDVCTVSIPCSVTPGQHTFGVEVLNSSGSALTPVVNAADKITVNASNDCKPVYKTMALGTQTVKQEEQASVTFTELLPQVSKVKMNIGGKVVEGTKADSAYKFAIPCEVPASTYDPSIRFYDSSDKEISFRGGEQPSDGILHGLKVTAEPNCTPFTNFALDTAQVNQNGQYKAKFATVSNKVTKIKFYKGDEEIKTVDTPQSCVGDGCAMPKLDCESVGDKTIKAVLYKGDNPWGEAATATLKVTEDPTCRPYDQYSIEPTSVDQKGSFKVKFGSINAKTSKIVIMSGDETLSTIESSQFDTCKTTGCTVQLNCHKAGADQPIKAVAYKGTKVWEDKANNKTVNLTVTDNVECKPYDQFTITPASVDQNGTVKAKFNKINPLAEKVEIKLDGKVIKTLKSADYTACTSADGCELTTFDCESKGSKTLTAVAYKDGKVWDDPANNKTAPLTVTENIECKPFDSFAVASPVDQDGTTKATFVAINKKVKSIKFKVGDKVVTTIDDPATCKGAGCDIKIGCDTAPGDYTVVAELFDANGKLYNDEATAAVTVNKNFDACYAQEGFKVDQTSVDQKGTFNAKFDKVNAKVKKIELLVGSEKVATFDTPADCANGDGCAVTLDCLKPFGEKTVTAKLFKEVADNEPWQTASAKLSVTRNVECSVYGALLPVEEDGSVLDIPVKQQEDLRVRVEGMKDEVTEVEFLAHSKVVSLGRFDVNDYIKDAAPRTYEMPIPCTVAPGRHMLSAKFYNANGMIEDTATYDNNPYIVVAKDPKCDTLPPLAPADATGASLAKTGGNSGSMALAALGLLGLGMVVTLRRRLSA